MLLRWLFTVLDWATRMFTWIGQHMLLLVLLTGILALLGLVQAMLKR